MIVNILSIILFLIFSVLAAFHFYWFFGGKWGLDSVFPTKNDEASAIAIPKFATLVVAIGLAAFGFAYLMKAGMISLAMPSWLSDFAFWFIPSIFILRAIGEFNYVGFFKKVKHTKFAKADSKIFAPLCLLIGVLGLLIQLLK